MSVYMVQSSLNGPDGPAVPAVSTSACLCEGVNVREREKRKGGKKRPQSVFCSVRVNVKRMEDHSCSLI